MKLDFDIVRNTLLDIEENTNLENGLIFNKNNTDEDIFYTLIKLKEAGFIDSYEIKVWSGIISIRVKSLTWSGHQFLDNIRSPKVVEHTKSAIKKVGSASLQIMNQIASAFILSKLGL